MNWRLTVKNWRQRQTKESGFSIPLAAIGMTAMLGFTGVALDFGYFYSYKRAMQTAADAAALAGAHERKRAQDSSSITTSVRAASHSNGFTHGVNGISVNINNPPTTGYFSGDNRFVEVTITRATPSVLLRIFKKESVTIMARAVAGIRPNPDPCVIALNNVAEKAFMVHSSSYFTANCGIHSNSNANNGYYVTSNGNVTSTSNSVTGRSEITSGSTVAPAVRIGATRVVDPLAYLSAPTYGACDYTNYKASSATVTLDPGVYCGGIEIADGSVATFHPGLYVIVDKGLLVTSGSIVTGTGVTFFNTGGDDYLPIRLESGSQATLSAPTAGTWMNILFYQDRTAGKVGVTYDNYVASSSNSIFTGAIYFPTQRLNLSAGGSTSTYNGIIVADTILVAGNSVSNVNGSVSNTPPTSSAIME